MHGNSIKLKIQALMISRSCVRVCLQCYMLSTSIRTHPKGVETDISSDIKRSDCSISLDLLTHKGSGLGQHDLSRESQLEH